MGRPKSAPLPSSIGEVLGRIEAWRAIRTPGRAMPDALWEEAVSWAGRHGSHPVAKALGLNPKMLKRRVNEDQRLGLHQISHPIRPTFIEMDGGIFTGAQANAGGSVDVVRPDGGRLVVRLAPGREVDLCGLVQTFLGSLG